MASVIIKKSRHMKRADKARGRKSERVENKVAEFMRDTDEKPATPAYRAFKAGAISKAEAVQLGCKL